MADEAEPTVPVVCEVCGTETDVRLSELEATINRHNESVHGGEEEAGVDPTLRDEIARLAAADIIADDSNPS